MDTNSNDITVNAVSYLCVGTRVPVWVVNDDSVGSRQVNPYPTNPRGQKKDKYRGSLVKHKRDEYKYLHDIIITLYNIYLIESLNEWLTGFNRSVTIHPDVCVALDLNHLLQNAQHLSHHSMSVGEGRGKREDGEDD